MWNPFFPAPLTLPDSTFPLTSLFVEEGRRPHPQDKVTLLRTPSPCPLESVYVHPVYGNPRTGLLRTRWEPYRVLRNPLRGLCVRGAQNCASSTTGPSRVQSTLRMYLVRQKGPVLLRLESWGGGLFGLSGPRMGVGSVVVESAFLGRPDFQSTGPKTPYFEGFRSNLGQKSGAPQTQIQRRRIQHPILGPLRRSLWAGLNRGYANKG